MFCRSLCFPIVILPLAIVLSVLLITPSDYPFGISIFTFKTDDTILIWLSDENGTQTDLETNIWFDFCVHTTRFLLKACRNDKSVVTTWRKIVLWDIIFVWIRLNHWVLFSELLVLNIGFKICWDWIPLNMEHWLSKYCYLCCFHEIYLLMYFQLKHYYKDCTLLYRNEYTIDS